MKRNPCNTADLSGFSDASDHYEILELKPEASPNEIRDAYFRIKATYQKDSVALYSLMDGPECEEMLQKVEEAYRILSSPERRREYDRFAGRLEPELAKVIPIHRTPAPAPAPMESISKAEDPLIPPRTDFPEHSPTLARTTPLVPLDLEKEISAQTEWSGQFLRRVRENSGVSIEEVTQVTKVTKTYILAIEEENFGKLPAAVFIRGFVAQIARLLKLPQAQVTASYMARYERAKSEKTS